jgi:hypothetical protein
MREPAWLNLHRLISRRAVGMIGIEVKYGSSHFQRGVNDLFNSSRFRKVYQNAQRVTPEQRGDG